MVYVIMLIGITYAFIVILKQIIQKALLFKSFIGLTVQEFDGIYDREITKRYGQYEISAHHSSKRKDIEKEKPEHGDDSS